jgi:lysophospholipase L1-like esterase
MFGTVRKGDLLLAGAAALVGLAVLALAGEAVVRARERHRATLGGTMPLLFYRHGTLGHALVRGFDYAGRIHIDREGFRGPDVALRAAPGAARIMAVGSSTTFDPGVSGDAAAWPARLQFWLARMAPACRVEVINAGVPGYVVITDLVRLVTDLRRYRPDVIVLYEGHNDLFGALRRGVEREEAWSPTPGEMPAVTPWGYWLSRHSLLYGKLVARLKVLRFHASGRRALAAAASRAEDELLAPGVRQFEEDVTLFLAAARTLGASVAVPELVHVSGVGSVDEPDPTLRQVWSSTVPFATPATVLRGYVRYNLALEAATQRVGATWIPTGPFGLAGPQWYAPGDPIHFNDRGADRMAHRLADALLASGLLDRRARPGARGGCAGPRTAR